MHGVSVKSKQFAVLSATIFLLATMVFLVAPRMVPEFVDTFDRESGLIELLSASCYLIGCLICVYRLASKTRRDRPYLYLWAFLCFMFLGEETSWLQHMIGYGTPEAVRQVNVQGEFNLHNLVVDGSWHDALTGGKLDYRLFLSSTFLFRVGFLSYFLVVPVMMHSGLLKRIKNWLRYPLPSIAFVVMVGVTLSISVLGYYLAPDSRMELTEAREAFYALFVMLYILIYLGTERTSGAS